MTNMEKIEKHKAAIEKNNQTITSLQQKNKSLLQEIHQLETAEIQGILQESNVSIPELRELLKKRNGG